MSHNKEQFRTTGGGENKMQTLNDIEEAIASLMEMETAVNPSGQEFGLQAEVENANEIEIEVVDLVIPSGSNNNTASKFPTTPARNFPTTPARDFPTTPARNFPTTSASSTITTSKREVLFNDLINIKKAKLEIEKEKLNIQQQQLNIEKEKFEIKKEKLEMEKERLHIEKENLKVQKEILQLKRD